MESLKHSWKRNFTLSSAVSRKTVLFGVLLTSFRKPWKDRHLFCSHSNGVGDLWSHNFRRLWQRNNICVVCSRSVVQKQTTRTKTLLKRALLLPLRCSFRNSRPPTILNVHIKRARRQKGPKVRWKIRNTASGKGNEKEERNWTEKGWMFTSSVDYFKVLMCSFYYQTVVIC